MDWEALFWSAFQCVDRAAVPRLVLVLGALGTLATVVAAIHSLYRWLVKRGPTHGVAATALWREGWLHARLNRRGRAAQLYDLSIKLNPQQGHVYYLRGLLREPTNPNGAVADWERCLRALPKHHGALAKLAQHRDAPQTAAVGRLVPRALVLRIAAATAFIVFIALLFWPDMPLRSGW